MYVWDNFLEQKPNLKGKKIISIVFDDRDDTFSDECLVLKRYRRNPIVVHEYVFPIHGDGQYINRQAINNVIADIKRINETELYIDFTGKSTYFKRVSINPPSQKNSSTPKTDNTNYGNNEDEVSENKEYNTINMKRTIKLTESDLRHIIKESVRDYLTELDWKTYANAANKAEQYAFHNTEQLSKEYLDYLNRSYRLKQAAQQRFNDEYGYDDPDNNEEYCVQINGRYGPTSQAWDKSRAKCYPAQKVFRKICDAFGNTQYRDCELDPNRSSEKVRSAKKWGDDELDRYYLRHDYKYIKGKGWQ